MIGFTEKRKIWYAISAVIIIAGIISMLVQGFNLGIDFEGGSILQLRFEKEADIAGIRSVVESFTEQTPNIQSSDNSSYNIKISVMTEEGIQQIIAALEEVYGEAEIIRSDLIGPVIGGELLRNAQIALVIALVLMLIYISVRFKLNYAISAIAALCHDVLILLSVFSFLQIEVDSTFVASILTVVGYSINNTIVVFDRIRENENKSKAKADFGHTINISIRQTLARSINMVLAVLFVLFALLLFGGETTKVFSFAIITGCIAGFYSSLLLVGSMLLDIVRIRGRARKPSPAGNK
jgi:preprotein translocase subunit SecF